LNRGSNRLNQGGDNLLFDYSKLRGRIIEKFKSQLNFSKTIGVSQRTLSLKLNNKVFFSQDDIVKMSKLLEIKPREIHTYFFTQKVQ
jgi:hypothetical protein